MSRPAHRFRADWTATDRAALIGLLAIWGALLAARATGVTVALTDPPAVDRHRVGSVRERIDPNTASVASLRRLPRIGPALAEEIVRYRRSRPPGGQAAFCTADDLQNVHRIGPKTVERLWKFLAIPPGPAQAAPATRRR